MDSTYNAVFMSAAAKVRLLPCIAASLCFVFLSFLLTTAVIRKAQFPDIPSLVTGSQTPNPSLTEGFGARVRHGHQLKEPDRSSGSRRDIKEHVEFEEPEQDYFTHLINYNGTLRVGRVNYRDWDREVGCDNFRKKHSREIRCAYLDILNSIILEAFVVKFDWAG